MLLDKMIPRIEGISKEDFTSKYVLSNTPVVIENAVSDWPAFDCWSAEYFSEKIGDVQIGLKKSETFKHPDITQRDPGSVTQMTFKEYLSKTVFSNDENDRKKYYVSGDENTFFQDGKENDSLSALRKDFLLPEYFDKDLLRQVSFWVSVKGLFSWLHFDGNCHHNVNVQVAGSKRIMLFDPKQVENLYPFLLRETAQGFNFSKVDLTNVDLSRFPKFEKVTYQEAILNRGDMLFIPCAWYHAVEHLGDVNINVNFWWEPTLYQHNPMVLRSKMMELFDRSYLRENVMKEAPPRWENWCKKCPEIAEFIFKCDEQILNKVN